MLRRSMTRLSLLSFLGAAACSDGGAGPKLPPCTAAGFQVTLPVVSAYTSIDPGTAAGCIVFPAASATDSAEYLVVPQLTTGAPGKTSSFRLAGDTIRPALIAPAYSAPALDDLAPAERFHAFLRLGDQDHWRSLNPQVAVPGMMAPARSPAAPAGPPAMGSQRTFKVCARLNCCAAELLGVRQRDRHGESAQEQSGDLRRQRCAGRRPGLRRARHAGRHVRDETLRDRHGGVRA